MIGEVEDRSLDEPLGLEATDDEISKRTIKYTRDLLLEFIEVEVCRKLPTDFDLLILSELGEGHVGKTERESLSGNSWLCASLSPTTSRFSFPGDRLEDNQSKGSQWLGNCSSEMSDAVCKQVPQKSRFSAAGVLGRPIQQETSDAVCKQVPQKSRLSAAGVLGRPIQQGDLHQLKRCEKPYRPPHLDKKRLPTLDTSVFGAQSSEGSFSSPIESNKSGSASNITEDGSVKIQETLDTCSELGPEPSFSPNESNQSGSANSIAEKMQETSDTCSELGAECSELGPEPSFSPNESNQSGSANSIAEKMQETSDPCSELGAESSEGSSFSPIESNQRGSADSITENGKPEYRFPLTGIDETVRILFFGQCEATWVNNDLTGKVDGNDNLNLGIFEDDEVTYQKYWDEILDVVQLQLEPQRLPSPPRKNSPDQEVKNWFPDEDSLIPLDHSTIPENPNLAAPDKSNYISDSEAEIIWPDEDSLITIDDLFPPEALKLTSNIGAVISEKNSESPNFTNSSNRFTSHGCNAQSLLELSASATQGKPRLENDHMNFRTKINTVPYTPSLSCYACPNFHFQSLQETNLTKTNDTFVQYSLLQQPKICPEQQNHQLVKQVAKPEVNIKQFLNWASPRPIYQGFGK